MMPVARGEPVTRLQILLYSVQLVIITLLPGPFQMLGLVYMLAATVLGAGLLVMSLRLIKYQDGAAAKRMYKYSTAYLAFLFLAMMLDQILKL
jgi:heme o synthase